MDKASPLVSIIVATYNSSHVLSYAIRSVLESTFQDWEMIVIGDCCTDDTEEVIHGFEESRISFQNLKKNSGQQATPTNVALQKVKGKYIAFLNQDDLYFSDHLMRCVKEIEGSNADFLVTPAVKIAPSDSNQIYSGSYQAEMYAVHPNEKLSPIIFSIASTWFVRKTLADLLGPWKLEKDVYVTPSQEWLFRAFKSKAKFYFPKRVGLLIIHSAERKGFYLENSSFEHDHFFSRLNSPELKAEILEKAAIRSAASHNHLVHHIPHSLLKRMLGVPFQRILGRFNIHPNTFRLYMKWGKKGKLIEHLKKIAEEDETSN
jgi:glycosyltransferase involved in cell wall biosynthesis